MALLPSTAAIFSLLILTVRAQDAVEGVFHRIRGHTPAGVPADSFFLIQDSGVVNQLLMDDPPGTVGTGVRVALTTSSSSTGGKDFSDSALPPGQNAFHVEAGTFDVLPVGGQKDVPSVGQPFTMRSITWILNIGGVTNKVTKEDVKANWFEHGGSGSNLQGYYNACTYGLVNFTPDNNLVVGPIDVPKNGHMTGGYAYDATRCTGVEPYAWAEYAQNYTKNVLGIDISHYSRRIVILSDNVPCGWAGLGSVGCGAYCFTWVLASYALNVQTLFHELGHNMGMQHSTTPTNEYGDGSCVMASCCIVKCFNVPQQWRLGWSSPIAVLNGSVFTPGKWLTFVLPATALNSVNHLQIMPTWMPGGPKKPTYFVSYRQPLLYDSAMQSPYRYRVYVHVYNGTQGLLTGDKPELQAFLKFETYRNTWAQWVVTAESINGSPDPATVNASTVKLCRYTALFESNCHDGLDNDCNGLVDADDPACAGVSSAPPSPPPASPGVCGNGICDGSESPATCAADCCLQHSCGDGMCDAYAGENCLNCPQDCKSTSTLCCGGGIKSASGCPPECLFRGRTQLGCNMTCNPISAWKDLPVSTALSPSRLQSPPPPPKNSSPPPKHSPPPLSPSSPPPLKVNPSPRPKQSSPPSPPPPPKRSPPPKIRPPPPPKSPKPPPPPPKSPKPPKPPRAPKSPK